MLTIPIGMVQSSASRFCLADRILDELQHRSACVVLDGDEHDALGGPRLLTHQHQPGGGQPFAVASIHRIRAGDDAPSREIGPQKARGMLTQREADVSAVLDDFSSGRHRP
jgi:hypothetical protein